MLPLAPRRSHHTTKVNTRTHATSRLYSSNLYINPAGCLCGNPVVVCEVVCNDSPVMMCNHDVAVSVQIFARAAPDAVAGPALPHALATPLLHANRRPRVAGALVGVVSFAPRESGTTTRAFPLSLAQLDHLAWPGLPAAACGMAKRSMKHAVGEPFFAKETHATVARVQSGLFLSHPTWSIGVGGWAVPPNPEFTIRCAMSI